MNTPADANAITRNRSSTDITSMPRLPQLPEAWAQEIYDMVEERERKLAAPNLLRAEYELGTASSPDEIFEARRSDEVGCLFTAEHATSPVRAATGSRDYPDAGTGGLVALLAENYGTGLIMRGDQTSNAATDPEHPIKPRIARYLAAATGYVSVHGMAPGKFMARSDTTEIQASIGLGADPTDHQREFAEKIVKLGRDMFGLYVVIGNDGDYFVQKPNSTELKRNQDGTPYRNRLAALKPNMTVNFARRQLSEAGRQVPVVQIELTKLLRLTPSDTDNRDPVSRIIGVALGYRLLEEVAKLALGEIEDPVKQA
ncbi:MAG TPA: hypothetical protein VM124_00825 [Candidatus Limnocylindrales bacterium]|nr:hypothetical protein [Candidatus Limnocylindrales bacterium]